MDVWGGASFGGRTCFDDRTISVWLGRDDADGPHTPNPPFPPIDTGRFSLILLTSTSSLESSSLWSSFDGSDLFLIVMDGLELKKYELPSRRLSATNFRGLTFYLSRDLLVKPWAVSKMSTITLLTHWYYHGNILALWLHITYLSFLFFYI